MSLRYALLGLLAESPKYGYEIKQKFEASLANVWSVSYGQLYPTLHRLSELGWVSAKREPGKRAADKTIYSITASGLKSLEEWLVRPTAAAYRLKDEFTLRFLFFGKLPRERVVQDLERHRERVKAERRRFEKAFVAVRDASGYFLQAIIRKGIRHLEAESDWLGEVLNDLRTDAPAGAREQEQAAARDLPSPADGRVGRVGG